MESMKKPGQLVENGLVSTHQEQVEEEIAAAKEWLAGYQELEAELIDQGKAVDFKSMKEEMKARKMEKPVVKEAMIYKGEVIDDDESVLEQYLIKGGFITRLVLATIVAILLVTIFGLVRAKTKNKIF